MKEDEHLDNMKNTFSSSCRNLTGIMDAITTELGTNTAGKGCPVLCRVWSGLLVYEILHTILRYMSSAL